MARKKNRMSEAGHGASRVQLGPRAEAILSFLSWHGRGGLPQEAEAKATSLYYQAPLLESSWVRAVSREPHRNSSGSFWTLMDSARL